MFLHPFLLFIANAFETDFVDTKCNFSCKNLYKSFAITMIKQICKSERGGGGGEIYVDRSPMMRYVLRRISRRRATRG